MRQTLEELAPRCVSVRTEADRRRGQGQRPGAGGHATRMEVAAGAARSAGRPRVGVSHRGQSVEGRPAPQADRGGRFRLDRAAGGPLRGGSGPPGPAARAAAACHAGHGCPAPAATPGVVPERLRVAVGHPDRRSTAGQRWRGQGQLVAGARQMRANFQDLVDDCSMRKHGRS